MIVGFPHKPGHGGPGSFQSRFQQSLVDHGFSVSYPRDGNRADVIFVVGGTRRLFWLWKMKKNGALIIHRLDGLAWLHCKNGWRRLLHGEWTNFVFKFIQGFLADHVVYQSNFVRDWWKNEGWNHPKSYSIIYNGVDLDEFKPISTIGSNKSLLCVEGTLDYSPYAIEMLNHLQTELIQHSNFSSLILFGGFQNEQSIDRLNPMIDYRGKVDRKDLPGIYKDSVYLSLDVNPACPNTVIEALSCGVPVVGFNTGALKEIVPSSAGIVVPYGSDPWNLEYPDVHGLVAAIRKVHENWQIYSEGARKVAVERYDLNHITAQYLEVIEEAIKRRNENR